MTGLKLGIGGALPRWLWIISVAMGDTCLLYTSDAADE